MNYIWELKILSEKQNKDFDETVFHKGEYFSPYMELSFENINETECLREVEINPYYRYYTIFKNLFYPDNELDTQLVELIHDLAIHHLADIDVLMGMDRRQYQIEFIVHELELGQWGDFIQKRYLILSLEEKKIIANLLLDLYQTGEEYFFFKKAVQKFFPKAYLFLNSQEKEEIMIYMRLNQNSNLVQKLELIQSLFLPISYKVEIYWKDFIGVLGCESCMKIGSILNYG